MSNNYGICEKVEKHIRARDTICVYCRVLMKRPSPAKHRSEASIEHFNNDRPLTKEYNLAICCRGCNSSKGTKRLLTWFKTPYCIEREINIETVAGPVKKYINERL
jgi:5-methylcytosine-specific restriction endonuclease McrA